MSIRQLHERTVTMSIGENIKLLRGIRGLTQQELAELAGVAPGTLAHIEKGTRNPSLDMLYNIADKLSVSIINLVLTKEEIDRFYFDDEIQQRYPGSERLKEILQRVLENNTTWDKTKKIAIIDVDDII